jgi:alpha-L-fucosidase 2
VRRNLFRGTPAVCRTVRRFRGFSRGDGLALSHSAIRLGCVKPTRRQFLQTSAFATLAAAQPLRAQTDPVTPANEPLDAFAIAHRHSLTADLPTPNFFEGMLLGNGDVGLCVVVRPDALGLHIGKNDCWDIRLSEEVEEHVLPFSEFLKLWQRASDEAKRRGKPDMLFLESNIDFFREYTRKTETSYLRPWPRPWPCGTVWLHWDPRWVQAGTHTLDPANGMFTLELKCGNPTGDARTAKLSCFVDWTTGLISASTDAPVSFSSLSYYPQIDEGQRSPEDTDGSRPRINALPPPQLDAKAAAGFAEISCFQHFPALGPTEKMPSPPPSDRDRNFALQVRLAGGWSLDPAADKNRSVALKAAHEQPLQLDIKLATPREILLARSQRAADHGSPILIPQDHAFTDQELDTRSYARNEIERLSALPIDQLRRHSEACWRDFWSHSAVHLEDQQLERIWYHNQYFLACCLRHGQTAPGLFANWSTHDLGTAWHGDYHLDYNCQQVYWGVFSSNHAEQHLPYVEMCQNLQDMCEKFTRVKFQMPGACFPLTAVPVPSQSVFIPSPPFAYQVSNTSWTVQSLWWHYLYTQDEDYLQIAYPILRSAARFLAAYVTKQNDGRYHIIPTVSAENWGLTVDFRLNKDCILDLALTRFLLDAVSEASAVLSTDAEERLHWKEIGEHLAAYPRARSPFGEAWIDVQDAPAEVVYNVPITLGPVFPAEQVGIGRNPDQLDLARRTAMTVRLEGGNDLVFQPLIRARLGVLDLDWFKREVRYCTLPNGVANDRVRQIGGRYDDSTDFDYMMRMGIWTENFSLPAVLNECMLQSYTGTIYLFPNTIRLGPSRFQNLRAAGAFLVSAAYAGKKVANVVILSEKGKTARMATPWGSQRVKVVRQSDGTDVAVQRENEILIFETQPKETYSIEPEV